VGFLIGLAGLVARFLSNERRLEFVLSPEGERTKVTVKGYSRYYPAFLEREVIQLAEIIKE
jgi:cytochrome c biogenesis protein